MEIPPGGAHDEEKQRHVPVLLKEAIEYLHVRPGARWWTARSDLAGHAAEIVRRLGPEGRLIGFDRDPEAMAAGQREAGPGLRRSWASQAPEIELIGEAFSSQRRCMWRPASVDGVLADFGVSSLQLDEAAQRIQFYGGWPLWICGWIRARDRPPHKW